MSGSLARNRRNRGHRRRRASALSHLVLDQLSECLDRGSVPHLVIAGRPGASALVSTCRSWKQGMDAASELMEKGAELALQLHEWPKPRVFTVTGHAMAMGAVLLGCADLRIGAMGGIQDRIPTR
ncbi:MAG: hypothetical protein M5U19_14595 [Microthrixaceae bacterium]|nr:hypothetical protein [Microthrixaceae bacterium]